jgi:hypothetical protein
MRTFLIGSLPNTLVIYSCSHKQAIRILEYVLYLQFIDSHMPELLAFVLRSYDLQEEIKTGIIKVVNGMYVPSYAIIELTS